MTDQPAGSAGERAGNATVRRLLVGIRLRHLRESAGISREQAGHLIRASESKMSRMELGRVSFKERDIRDLAVLYGVTDPAEREALVALSKDASRPSWWRQYDDITPNWFVNYIGLEEAAATIRTYEVQFVPGLLQTPAYTRALMRSAVPRPSSADLDRSVDLRATRQRILTRENPPQLWTVLDEAALRRPVGDREVAKEQLDHLAEVAQSPAIALQILPLRYGAHSPSGGPFAILRFADQSLADVVYLEQLMSAYYFDKQQYVERYTHVFNQLVVESLTPQESIDFLRKLSTEIS